MAHGESTPGLGNVPCASVATIGRSSLHSSTTACGTRASGPRHVAAIVGSAYRQLHSVPVARGEGSTRSTGKERDAETGLDYFGATYVSDLGEAYPFPGCRAVSHRDSEFLTS